MSKDPKERRHRPTYRHLESIAFMASADFDAVPSLAEAMSGPNKCELCGLTATHADSIPDATVCGYSPSEAGYRTQYLCPVHAAERRKVNTARVIELAQ